MLTCWHKKVDELYFNINRFILLTKVQIFYEVLSSFESSLFKTQTPVGFLWILLGLNDFNLFPTKSRKFV
jgi:hypothetical protein